MRDGSKGMVSIDLETLGLQNNAVILSVGVCVTPWKFNTVNELRERSINIKLDVKDQITNYGMKTHPDVVNWWKEQGPDSREILKPSSNDIKLAELPGVLEKFFERHGVNWKDYDTYDRRCFDMTKLQYVYEEALGYGHGKVPWNFVHMYEFGTALSYLGADRYGGVRPEEVGLIYHNSQDDAILDAYRLLKCLKEVELIQ